MRWQDLRLRATGDDERTQQCHEAADLPALGLSREQLRTAQLTVGACVFVRDASAQVVVPAVVHAAFDDAPSLSSAENGVASAALMAHFPGAPTVLQIGTPSVDRAKLPLAQHVSVRARRGAQRHAPVAPLSHLSSLDLLSLLPSLLAGRVLSVGSLLQHELLRGVYGIEALEVVQVTQLRHDPRPDATAASAASADPVAYLLTPQSVLSLLPASSDSPVTALTLAPLSAFPSSPEQWLRRIQKRVYGFHSLLQSWIGGMWSNVRQYERERDETLSTGVAPASLVPFAPHAFLLHGLSGSGKTHLASTVAGCSGLPYFFLHASALFRRDEGASEAALVSLFASARQEQSKGRPVIVVLDELDTILPRLASEVRRDGDDDDPAGGAVLKEKSSAWHMGNARIEWRLVGVLKELLAECNSLSLPSASSTTGAAASPAPPLFVLFTTSSPQSLDAAGMRSSPYVDQELELKALSVSERVSALEMGMARFVFEEERVSAAAASQSAAIRAKIFERLAAELHGFVGADMDGLIRETLLAAITRCKFEHAASASPLSFSPAHVQIRRADYESVLGWFRPSNLQQIEFRLPKTAASAVDDTTHDDLARIDLATTPLPPRAFAHHFASMAGITPLLEHLHYSFLLPIKQPLLYQTWQRTLAMRASKGVLLYGPSGCGKSALAVCIARAAGLNTLVVPSASIVGKVIGSAEKSLAGLFARARASAPSLLVFDQIEMLAPTRKGLVTSADDEDASHDADAYERILSVLLIEMDGVLASSSSGSDQVFVLATSARPDQVDPALLRPGRLDTHLHMAAPSQEARAELLALAFKNTPLHVQRDEQSGKILVPNQFSLVWATMDAQARDRIVEVGWDHAVVAESKDSDEDQSPSDPETVSFFLRLLSHLTPRFSGADISSLVREAAMHSLRRSGLQARVVASWSDVLQATLRGMRGSLSASTAEFHPFGAKKAAASAPFAWASDGPFAPTKATTLNTQSIFKKKRHEEVAAKSMASASLASARSTAAASGASAAPAAVAAASAFPSAPFVFESTAAPESTAASFAPSAAFSFAPFAPVGDGASSASSDSAQPAFSLDALSFSMGAADTAPPPRSKAEPAAASAGSSATKSRRDIKSQH